MENDDKGQLVTFGRHVRRLRRDSDRSQDSVAEDMGITTGHLSAIERGVKQPRLLTIIKLAKALRVTPATLFDPFSLGS